MKRCKHCLIRIETESTACPVCGLPPMQARRKLSKEQRRIRICARLIRAAALLHLIVAGLTLLGGLCLPLYAVLLSVLVNIAVAFGLARYAFWAYRAATILYFFIGMVNIIAVNIPETLIILILLYCVGNDRARGLFDRRTA